MSKSALDFYFDSIRDIPVLSQEQEIRLIQKAQAGSKRARNKLIKHNLKLVVDVAHKRFHASTLSMSDLISEGNLGLMKAIGKFNVSKGNKFSTYAVGWIRAYISRSIMDKETLIRTPVYLSKKRRDYLRFIERFEQKHQRLPTLEEVSKGLPESPETVERIKQSIMIHMRVNERDRVQIPLHDTEIDLTKLKFKTKRDKIIFKMRFGFEPFKQEYSYAEIGKNLKISRQRVHQILKQILKKLSKSSYIKEFFEK